MNEIEKRLARRKTAIGVGWFLATLVAITIMRLVGFNFWHTLPVSMLSMWFMGRTLRKVNK